MKRKRAEFSTITKLKALVRYIRCPGVPELGISCGKPFGTLSDICFDHISAENVTHDNSPENCRPLCKECHDIKTFGRGGSTAGSDIHKAAKIKRISKTKKFEINKNNNDVKIKKNKIPSRPFPSRKMRKHPKDGDK